MQPSEKIFKTIIFLQVGYFAFAVLIAIAAYAIEGWFGVQGDWVKTTGALIAFTTLYSLLIKTGPH